MSKDKQPYIPLYIGDWEQDTNCLSLEAEGALLKLIFKLWKSEKKGVSEFSFNQLSILFKKSPETTKKIVSELHENGVLNIVFLENERVKFESRRMLKDIAKSLTYSGNGSKGGRPKKANGKLNESKLKAKAKLIHDNDIDNEHDNVGVVEKKKGVQGGKSKTTAQIAFDLIPDTFHGDEFAVLWDDYEKLRKKKNKPLTETAVKQRVGSLIAISGGDWGIAKASMEETISSGWDRFFEVKPKTTQNGHDPRYSHTFVKDKA